MHNPDVNSQLSTNQKMLIIFNTFISHISCDNLIIQGRVSTGIFKYTFIKDLNEFPPWDRELAQCVRVFHLNDALIENS